MWIYVSALHSLVVLRIIWANEKASYIVAQCEVQIAAGFLEHNPLSTQNLMSTSYSEVGPIVFNGAYSQETVHRIAGSGEYTKSQDKRRKLKCHKAFGPAN